MKSLILVDGAAGTGKSDLISYLERRYKQPGQIGLIRKVTTRQQRAEEVGGKLNLDLVFISDDDFDAMARNPEFYQYEYGGERYGFSRLAVNEALARHRMVILIVRNLAVIQQLRSDFPRVRVVTLFVHSDPAEVRERLIREGFSEEYISLRARRGQIAWEDYLKHSECYDRVLLNNGSRVDFERLVENVVSWLGAESPDELLLEGGKIVQLPAALVGHKQRMLDRLRRWPYEKNVFLMMKFRPVNIDVAAFISETLQLKGLNCVRANDRDWNITRDVYNPVAVLLCCKYGVALFDEPEPGQLYSANVAYELGMMHLQRKECLILRHSTLPEVPFDLIKDLRVDYSRDLELRQVVLRWVEELGREIQPGELRPTE